MLGEMIVHALARPKVLLRQADVAEKLLKELKSLERQQSETMDEIFRSARAAEMQGGPGRLYFLPLAPAGSGSTTREIRRLRSSKTSSMLPDASTTSKP